MRNLFFTILIFLSSFETFAVGKQDVEVARERVSKIQLSTDSVLEIVRRRECRFGDSPLSEADAKVVADFSALLKEQTVFSQHVGHVTFMQTHLPILDDTPQLLNLCRSRVVSEVAGSLLCTRNERLKGLRKNADACAEAASEALASLGVYYLQNFDLRNFFRVLYLRSPFVTSAFLGFTAAPFALLGGKLWVRRVAAAEQAKDKEAKKKSKRRKHRKEKDPSLQDVMASIPQAHGFVGGAGAIDLVTPIVPESKEFAMQRRIREAKRALKDARTTEEMDSAFKTAQELFAQEEEMDDGSKRELSKLRGVYDHTESPSQ